MRREAAGSADLHLFKSSRLWASSSRTRSCSAIGPAGSVPRIPRGLGCPAAHGRPLSTLGCAIQIQFPSGFSVFRHDRGAQNRRYVWPFLAGRLTGIRNSPRIIKATLGAHQHLPGLRRAIYGKHRLGSEFVSELIPEVNLSGTVIP